MIFGCVAAVAWSAGALGQPQPRSTVSSPGAARAIARVATLDMWQVPTLQPRDYRIVALTLETAADIDPRDEDLLRRLIEAEDSAGRSDRMLDYTRRLIKDVAPGDTVAQLRLISANISSYQDVDSRLKAYDAFLGPKGEALDPSIRSRLALDAALLLRERGDPAAFATRLAEAIALDPTNKDAAATAVTYHSARSDDPAARLDLLLVLLKADPIDPETYLAIARHLTSVGAYKSALRFYHCTTNLAASMGLPADLGLVAEIHVAGWSVEGARTKLSTMRDQLVSQRKRIQDEADRLKKIGGFLMKLPDPMEVQFDVPAARVLLAAASALGDDALTDWSIAELALSVRTATEPPKLQPGEQQKPPEQPMTPDEKKQELADLLWMRLWSGRQIDQAEAQIKDMRADPDIERAGLDRVEGWLALRKGDLDASRQLLEPLAGADMLAELGLGVAKEVGGDTRGAGEWYADYFRRHAGSMAGLWARTRATALLGLEPAPPDDAARLEAVVDAIPKWLEGIVHNPNSFMFLQAEVGGVSADKPAPIESYPVHIRLRNTAPIPLALGAERVLNSRMLLTPSIWIGKDRVDDHTTMEVVSLSRRLRLMPQEVLEITVRTDNGWLWRKLALAGDKDVKMRWRLIQGFRVTPDHVTLAGPLSLYAETSVLTRPATPFADATPVALGALVETGSTDQVAMAVFSAGWRWIKPAEKGGFSPAQSAAFCAALAARYPSLDQSGRLLMLSMLPPATRVPALAPFDNAVRTEQDPATLSYILLTRITDPADPLLTEAEHAADGPAPNEARSRLAEMARLLHARLDEGLKGYAGMEDTTKDLPDQKPAGGATGTTSKP